jgi:hypothetical protein
MGQRHDHRNGAIRRRHLWPLEKAAGAFSLAGSRVRLGRRISVSAGVCYLKNEGRSGAPAPAGLMLDAGGSRRLWQRHQLDSAEFQLGDLRLLIGKELILPRRGAPKLLEGLEQGSDLNSHLGLGRHGPIFTRKGSRLQ